MWLTRLALRNPVLILMMSLAVLALGWVSLTRLAVDLFPPIDIPQIRVATFYPGAGPVDVEKSITVPIERAVSAAPGVDRVESVSKQGFSAVTVWFQYGVNLDNAQFEVQQRVAQILNVLPPGIDQPFIIKFDVTNIPVLFVSVSAEGLDEKQLYDLGYNVIEPQLERIKGVASAVIGGGKIREIEVMAKQEALRARGLGILDVVNAVRTSNLLLPSGSLRAGDRDYNVFSNTQFGQAKPLRDVVIRPARSGETSGPVRVSDIARVVDGSADQTEIARVDGQRAVYFRVNKQPGANTVAVVDAVKKAARCPICAASPPTSSWPPPSTSRPTSAPPSARWSTRRCGAACWRCW
jgi:multidrug efflux pump subunit AcrB